MLKIGIVGVGGIGSVHLEKWSMIPDIELVAVCDVRLDMALEKTKALHIPVYDSLDVMLHKESLDIIDICTPTYLHKEQAIKSIENGINVLVEKPAGLSSADAEIMFTKAKEYNVKLMVAHVLRFWDEYVFLKDYYKNRTYGDLLNASFWRFSETPRWSYNSWMTDEKLSGLVPFDLHIHDLDFIVSMMGKPDKIFANRGRRKNSVLSDFYSASYIYQDCFINCEAAWFDNKYPFTFGYRAHFENAVLEYHGEQIKVYLKDGTSKVIEGKEISRKTEINLPAVNAYYKEIEYFVNCVKNNCKIDVMDESEILNVIDAIQYGVKHASVD